MGFAQDMKRKTESIRIGGTFKSGMNSGPNTPTGGMVAASGPLDDYGYTKSSNYGDETYKGSSPVPSMMSTKSSKASYQEHKKNKFSRGGEGHLSPIATRAPASTFHGIGGRGSFTNLIHDDYRPLMDELKDTYRRKIRPLETTYNFEGFHSVPLSDSDIEAKPMVLLLGQYSTGKTTFIKHLTECDYPGSLIGVESTTDRFVAVMNGVESRVIPGNAAAVTADMPFRGLSKFGQTFLTRF
ncbi:hypothetical protein BGX29_001183 [Mortierella sp. GBA35]|nr:hypothetical protein BGX29_001183 [Mortierella sp. GBA35]